MKTPRLSLLLLSCVVVSLSAQAETLEGVVAFTGTAPVMPKLQREADPVCAKKPMTDESTLVKDGKLANVWVHVIAGAPDAKAPAQPVTIDQEECMYRPRVVTAIVGQTVLAKSSDATLHNVHARIGTETVFNKAMVNQSSKPVAYVVDRAGVLKLRCDVHPWMRGFVGTNKNALQAVSGETGAFRIEGLSPGKYTLEAWHEKLGTKTAELTVEAGKPARVAFTFDAADHPN